RRHDLFDPFSVAVVNVFTDRPRNRPARVDGFHLYLFVLSVVCELPKLRVPRRVPRIIKDITVARTQAIVGLIDRWIQDLAQLFAKSCFAFAELFKAGEVRVRLDKVTIAVTVELEGLLPRHELRAAGRRDVLHG